MTVYGIAMVRNEDDIIEPIVLHMLEEVDFLIVADNRSDDWTRAILESIPSDRLRILDAPDFAYHQADTMNQLADLALRYGADWIVPFDADEWWYSARGRIADVLAAMMPDVYATGTITYDMIPQPSDNWTLDVTERIRYTRPGSLWNKPESRKCAFRPGEGRRLLQGNHGLEGEPLPDIGPLRIRHYPFRTYEQAVAKLRHGRAAVQAAGLPPGSGSHWQEWGAYDDAQMQAWWRDWTNPEGLTLWQP